MYSIPEGKLSWAGHLPLSMLAVDARSSQLVVGTPAASLVGLNADGPLSQGLGLLGGLHVQAAQFYQAPGLQEQVRACGVFGSTLFV